MAESISALRRTAKLPGGRERKILVLLLALYVLLCLLLVFLISHPEATFDNAPANLIYYTTPEGSYYHQKDCPQVQHRTDCVDFSKAQCIQKGLTACPKCIRDGLVVREKIHLLSPPTPPRPLGNVAQPHAFVYKMLPLKGSPPADTEK